MTDIWDEKPESDLGNSIYHNPEMDAWLEALKVDYDLQYERSMRWQHFLMYGEYTPKQVSEWREYAEKWVQTSRYTNIREIAFDNIEFKKKLEAVNNWLENSEKSFDANTLEMDHLLKLRKILEAEK